LDAESDEAVGVFDDVTFVGEPAEVFEESELIVGEGRGCRCRWSFGWSGLWGQSGGRGGYGFGGSQRVEEFGQLHATGGILEVIDDGGDA
jgi:hypothetical protein